MSLIYPLLGAAFAIAGADKAKGDPGYEDMFHELGWSREGMQAVAAAEIAGGVLLALRPTRRLGAGILAVTSTAVLALERGLHVLLEKPMATTEEDCRAITAAARKSGAKLMIAYRLHFEPATVDALRLVYAGALGEPRLFTSTFTQHVSRANHRAQ